MFNAVAARRTSCALLRNPRAAPALSRSFAFTSQPRPLTHISKSNLLNPNIHLRSSPFILRQHLNSPQFRSLGYFKRTKISLRKGWKTARRDSPVTLTLALVIFVGAMSLWAYILYDQIIAKAPYYKKFPKPVEKSLRRAVYFTEVKLEPRRALALYKEALAAATECGLHPFSDEVVGIKLQVAGMLELAGLWDASIKVLEQTRAELLNWVADGRGKEASKKEAEEKQKKTLVKNPDVTDPLELEEYEKIKEAEEYERRQRDKAVKKAVGISVKISSIYNSDHVQDDKKAEAHGEAAVELALKELQYRESLGLPVSGNLDESREFGWISRTETSIVLFNLGSLYSQDETKRELAIPLYLRALEILRAEEGTKASCKQVMIMSKLGGAMFKRAQQPFRVKDPEAARRQALDAAVQWSLQAEDTYAAVPQNEKDTLCHLCRASAMNVVGEYAEAKGTLEDAAKWHTEALVFLEKLAKESKEQEYQDVIREYAEPAVKRVTEKLASK
ncbi:hypothetical protein BJY04DRAFT_188610 [Aspergillus karnatakaensis]|uniref:TPR domain protein n=1 Tax=Aspergillus karnatakaensis TaxID=1810916 RepID=UPI003CCD261A